jgi:hypothetical protein
MRVAAGMVQMPAAQTTFDFQVWIIHQHFHSDVDN